MSTITYNLNKLCEKCGIQIPDFFGNLLCLACYGEMEKKRFETIGMTRFDGYQERDEQPELDLVSRMAGRFKDTKFVMPAKQRKIYEAITEFLKNDIGTSPHYPKFIYKKTIIDIGCGLGIGSNILSREAKFVWGIDCNEENVNFAKQMFERMPNNLYQSCQLSFDVIDIKTFPREVMQFDYVCAIEIIEHLKEPKYLFDFIKRAAYKNSKVFISTPNRNADELQKNIPKNPHHVREYVAKEFYDLLIKQFQFVTLYDSSMQEKQELTSKLTPLAALCEGIL